MDCGPRLNSKDDVTILVATQPFPALKTRHSRCLLFANYWLFHTCHGRPSLRALRTAVSDEGSQAEWDMGS